MEQAFGTAAHLLRKVRTRDSTGCAAWSSASRLRDVFSTGLGKFKECWQIRCSGRHGKCSFKEGRPHEQLNGSSKTRQGQRYPARLAVHLAEAFDAEVRSRQLPGAMWDLYCGCGDVGKRFNEFGHEARLFDTQIRASDDLNASGFHTHFKTAISQSRVSCVHVAPPCSSFSVANSWQGHAIRSGTHALGLPGLTQAEQNRVNDGNRCVDSLIVFINLCNRASIPLAIENPATSYLWKVPAIATLCKSGHVADYHMCAFGAKWRKHTRHVFFNFSH